MSRPRPRSQRRKVLAACGSLALLLAASGCLGQRTERNLPAASSGASAPNGSAKSGGGQKSFGATNSPILFSQAPAERRIRFEYRNDEEAGHCTLAESLGGGAAAIDYDLDGWLDLCFPGGGTFTQERTLVGLPTGLFRNLGDRVFHPAAAPARIAPALHYTHGASAGDFDGDGFADLIVTGYTGALLWQNQGDGTFLEVSGPAGIDDRLWSSSAAWGDLNGDGVLDLYLAHYVNWSFANDPYCPGPREGQREICAPREFSGLPDKIYFGQGDGTFRDGSAAAGLRTDAASKGLGVLLADLDHDGDLDIYVTNDTTDNFLYLNDGRGKFQEVGLVRGVALDEAGVPNGSMGVDLCDFNKDGLPDLWVANYERESFALYRNEGAGQFLHVSQTTGITALGGLFVGFGTACSDLDQDGDEDMLVANGHVIKFPHSSPRKQLPLVLENLGGRFQRLAFAPDDYFSIPHEGRGLAAADFDNDGRLDAAISHLNAPVALLFNETQTDNGWLAVRLIGITSNRSAIGARLILHTSQGDQLRHIKGGGSYLSQNDPRVYWGLPKDAVLLGLTVHWPSGITHRTENIEANRLLTLVEPAS